MSRFGKREKNKWLRELEEYDREKNQTRDEDVFLTLEEEYERQYWEDVASGVFEDNDWDYNSDWEIDDFDDWEDPYYYEDDWDYDIDEDIRFRVKKPGIHIQDEEGNKWLASDKLEWVNLLTGETRIVVFGRIDIIFGL